VSISTTTTPPGTAGATARPHFPTLRTKQVAVGGLCWLLTLTFFIGQAVAQAATTTPYSLATNEISDLGVTTCGPLTVLTYHATVCSPWHDVMNGTFIAVGLLTLLGIMGTRRAWPQRRLTTWGLAFLALACVGEILAGLAPENINPGLHVVGALLGIPGANIGLLLLGTAVWRAHRWVGLFALLCGTVGLCGFVIAPSAGVAAGAAERLASYPVVVWMIVLGVFLLWSTARSQEQRHASTGAAA
jgi:hypothetical membrane protein